jgi:hypothetical protein
VTAGARADAVSPPGGLSPDCRIQFPVRLTSIALPDGDILKLPDQPIIDCDFALVLTDYIGTLVAPLGASVMGSKVTSISTGPGYECRGRNRVVGAKVSAHAKGWAVDFMTIDFADKRRVSVEKQTGLAEASYFHGIRAGACGWFTTVLGPGSDAYHDNNMHLDIEKHGSSASYRICQ